jgi:hypothetical protein
MPDDTPDAHWVSEPTPKRRSMPKDNCLSKVNGGLCRWRHNASFDPTTEVITARNLCAATIGQGFGQKGEVFLLSDHAIRPIR